MSKFKTHINGESRLTTENALNFMSQIFLSGFSLVSEDGSRFRLKLDPSTATSENSDSTNGTNYPAIRLSSSEASGIQKLKEFVTGEVFSLQQAQAQELANLQARIFVTIDNTLVNQEEVPESSTHELSETLEAQVLEVKDTETKLEESEAEVTGALETDQIDSTPTLEAPKDKSTTLGNNGQFEDSISIDQEKPTDFLTLPSIYTQLATAQEQSVEEKYNRSISDQSIEDMDDYRKDEEQRLRIKSHLVQFQKARGFTEISVPLPHSMDNIPSQDNEAIDPYTFRTDDLGISAAAVLQLYQDEPAWLEDQTGNPLPPCWAPGFERSILIGRTTKVKDAAGRPFILVYRTNNNAAYEAFEVRYPVKGISMADYKEYDIWIDPILRRLHVDFEDILGWLNLYPEFSTTFRSLAGKSLEQIVLYSLPDGNDPLISELEEYHVRQKFPGFSYRNFIENYIKLPGVAVRRWTTKTRYLTDSQTWWLDAGCVINPANFDSELRVKLRDDPDHIKLDDPYRITNWIDSANAAGSWYDHDTFLPCRCSKEAFQAWYDYQDEPPECAIPRIAPYTDGFHKISPGLIDNQQAILDECARYLHQFCAFHHLVTNNISVLATTKCMIEHGEDTFARVVLPRDLMVVDENNRIFPCPDYYKDRNHMENTTQTYSSNEFIIVSEDEDTMESFDCENNEAALLVA
ncbi:hypothetical protein BS50DRAFT_583114 [Corynespora cassiicola Philippines]|uniref:Uncharacterized protein n=1 Tax=Corynespora cassiicola Philippines TaxID=1448308 RepID=A0A2T2P7F4_CORCC|nr:hypothetical protein BS50DRAFT_583114 [Corynespora cassiicola Philippines]